MAGTPRGVKPKAWKKAKTVKAKGKGKKAKISKKLSKALSPTPKQQWLKGAETLMTEQGQKKLIKKRKSGSVMKKIKKTLKKLVTRKKKSKFKF